MKKSKEQLVRFEDLSFVPRFAYGDQAQVAEVSGTVQGTELGTGFVRVKNAKVPWTIKYDEVIVCIEGVFEILIGDEKHTLRAKDSMWLPKGTKMTYISEDSLVFYAIHPANWAANLSEDEYE